MTASRATFGGGGDRMLTVRRMAKGELRIFVDGAPLAGVVSAQIECVGFGRSNLVIKISGQLMRLEDEAGQTP